MIPLKPIQYSNVVNGRIELEPVPMGIGPIQNSVDPKDGSCHAFFVQEDGNRGHAIYDSLAFAWVDYSDWSL